MTQGQEPSHRLWRALLPALLTLMLVVALIYLGLARNRERVRGIQLQADSQRARATGMIESQCDAAARFLSSSQDPRGSWPTSDDSSTSTRREGDGKNLAGTMRILLNLEGTAYQEQRLYANGLGFIRQQRTEGSLVFPGEPSLETTSLAWLLLGEELGPPDHMRAFLRGQRTPTGLYSHRVEGPNQPQARSAPAAHVSDNLLLLGVLQSLGMDGWSLERRLRDHLGGGPDQRTISREVAAYLAALAAERGSAPALSLSNRLLEEISSTMEPTAWPTLDTVSLASYVAARSWLCVDAKEPCPDINPAARSLFARRRPDGSFLVPTMQGMAGPTRQGSDGDSPVLVAPALFAGSPAETTSLALRAMFAFRTLVESRSLPGKPS